MSELPSLVIREAKKEDLKKVFEIELKCFPDPYPIDLLKKLLSTYPETFLVAEFEGRIVGYIIAGIRWLSIGHILAIAVDPDYRNRGIGSALMKEIFRRFRKHGVTLVRLEVRKSNVTAIKFYRTLGFVERFEVPFYYADGESAITMERDLSPTPAS
ncbi:MAG: ribosomal protein S18-alanine N-acetyltransferase [Candidatus Hadarchaeales archaeon]